jgi:hypothetical protein
MPGIDDEWRREVNARLADHLERLEAGDKRMSELADGIKKANDAITKNNDMTESIKKNTEAVVTWVNNITGFRNVVTFLGDLAIRLAAVLGAVALVIYAVRTGDIPRKASASLPPTEQIVER